VQTWRDIDAALSPIIGPRGVAALYKRCIHLRRDDFPWLGAVYDGPLQPGDFDSLRTALSRQPHESIMAANIALFRTFSDLLTSLIGAALAERLLGPVWEKTSRGEAAQDRSS
jgi:hypothetical protein